MTKVCKTCQEEKPVEDFSISHKEKGYLFPHCKPCAAARKKAERHADPERYNAYQRDYYEKNRDRVLPQMRQANLRAYHRMKNEVLSLLGGVCARCGWRTSLQVDHVGGDGKEHRDECGGQAQSLRRIRDEMRAGTDNGRYQLLCANCHHNKSCSETSARSLRRRLSS